MILRLLWTVTKWADENYKRLLDVMFEVGLIEEGFYKASIKNKQTMVRRPGRFKPGVAEAIHKPLHTIRLREIQGAIEGLLHDMGDKKAQKEPTEIPF